MSALELHVVQTGADIAVDGSLIIAGYTGSDPEQVRRHIDELAKIGVTAPPKVPMLYPVDWSLLTTANAIDVEGEASSGEVEPVLIRHDDRWYLGLGSDHTDRLLEAHDVHESKKACPKPLAPEVLEIRQDPSDGSFDAVWETIRVGSTVDGAPYQRGMLTAIRSPSDLLGHLHPSLPHGDVVIFCGTVPISDGDFRPGRDFSASLACEDGHSLELRYTTTVTEKP